VHVWADAPAGRAVRAIAPRPATAVRRCRGLQALAWDLQSSFGEAFNALYVKVEYKVRYVRSCASAAASARR
jgi:hypothetical protein